MRDKSNISAATLYLLLYIYRLVYRVGRSVFLVQLYPLRTANVKKNATERHPAG